MLGKVEHVKVGQARAWLGVRGQTWLDRVGQRKVDQKKANVR